MLWWAATATGAWLFGAAIEDTKHKDQRSDGDLMLQYIGQEVQETSWHRVSSRGNTWQTHGSISEDTLQNHFVERQLRDEETGGSQKSKSDQVSLLNVSLWNLDCGVLVVISVLSFAAASNLEVKELISAHSVPAQGGRVPMWPRYCTWTVRSAVLVAASACTVGAVALPIFAGESCCRSALLHGDVWIWLLLGLIGIIYGGSSRWGEEENVYAALDRIQDIDSHRQFMIIAEQEAGAPELAQSSSYGCMPWLVGVLALVGASLLIWGLWWLYVHRPWFLAIFGIAVVGAILTMLLCQALYRCDIASSRCCRRLNPIASPEVVDVDAAEKPSSRSQSREVADKLAVRQQQVVSTESPRIPAPENYPRPADKESAISAVSTSSASAGTSPEHSGSSHSTDSLHVPSHGFVKPPAKAAATPKATSSSGPAQSLSSQADTENFVVKAKPAGNSVARPHTVPAIHLEALQLNQPDGADGVSDKRRNPQDCEENGEPSGLHVTDGDRRYAEPEKPQYPNLPANSFGAPQAETAPEESPRIESPGSKPKTPGGGPRLRPPPSVQGQMLEARPEPKAPPKRMHHKPHSTPTAKAAPPKAAAPPFFPDRANNSDASLANNSEASLPRAEVERVDDNVGFRRICLSCALVAVLSGCAACCFWLWPSVTKEIAIENPYPRHVERLSRFWKVSAWSECSATCGKGERKRVVVCNHHGDGGYGDSLVCAGSKCEDRDQEGSQDACKIHLDEKPTTVEDCWNYAECQWKLAPWSECSTDCGEGLQHRKISCSNGRSVDCLKHSQPPDRSRSCTRRSGCHWKVGDWGECSTQCGRGTQKRKVTCQNDDPDWCWQEESRPADSRPCDHYAGCDWHTGSWSSCSVSCGPGIQTRKVSCGNGGIAACEMHSEMPSQSQPCEAVEGCTWETGDWGLCSAFCGQGLQKRVVHCKNGPFEDCAEIQKEPNETRVCQATHGCEWAVGDWSSCGTVCGTSTMTRTVKCGNGPLESCKAHSAKPRTEKSCRDFSGCQWKTSQWSACSNSCGAGFHKREVSCANGGRSSCEAHSPAPASEEPCSSYVGCEWSVGPWSNCSNLCGMGSKERKVTCATPGASLEDCARRSEMPIAEEQCHDVRGCFWLVSAWSPCTSSCGDGKRLRMVMCGNGRPEDCEAHVANFDGVVPADTETCHGTRGCDMTLPAQAIALCACRDVAVAGIAGALCALCGWVAALLLLRESFRMWSSSSMLPTNTLVLTPVPLCVGFLVSCAAATFMERGVTEGKDALQAFQICSHISTAVMAVFLWAGALCLVLSKLDHFAVPVSLWLCVGVALFTYLASPFLATGADEESLALPSARWERA